MREKLDKRFDALNGEIQSVLQGATEISDHRGMPRFQFTLRSHAGWVTDEDRLLAIAFITRLSNIPVFKKVVTIEEKDGIRFANYNQATQIINDFRPIIQNERDDTHYKRIHKFALGIFKNRDVTKGLVVTVTNGAKKEITDDWIHNLGQGVKSVNFLLKRLEFDYVYNGILQHADERFRERYAENYQSGEIDYVIMKHALLLENIQNHLWNHLLSLNLGLVTSSTRGRLS